jgi:tetratricopeptide (TPR) repeat protein
MTGRVMHWNISVLLLTTVAWSLSLAAAQQPPAQAPKNNLQVLPKDLPWGELIETMEGFDRALGVHCEHCHVGQDPRFDFAADDKPTKQIARQMILLAREINTRVPAVVSKSPEVATRVDCVTCHRGVTQPKQLSEILTETVSAQGTAAGIDRYRELRAKYYGGQSFDFTEGGLIVVAHRFSALGKVEEAIDFLQLNLEFYPKSMRTCSTMAQVYDQHHNTAQEIKVLEKMLAIEPDNARARQQLTRLTQGSR